MTPKITTAVLLIMCVVFSLAGFIGPARSDTNALPLPPASKPCASLDGTTWPAAQAGNATLNITPGQTLYFKAASLTDGLLEDHDYDAVDGISTDQKDDSLQCQWDFNYDGAAFNATSSAGVNDAVNWVFAAAGTYIVKCRLDDIAGTAFDDAPSVTTYSITVVVAPSSEEENPTDTGSADEDQPALPPDEVMKDMETQVWEKIDLALKTLLPQGRNAEALQLIQPLLNAGTSPESIAHMHYILGTIAYSEARYNAARAEYLLMVSVNASEGSTVVGKQIAADCLRMNGNFTAAALEYEALIREHPGEVEYCAECRYLIGLMLAAQGRYQEALSQFNRVNTEYPTTSWVASANEKKAAAEIALSNQKGGAAQ
jgi:TolA-binding protein